MKLSVLAAVGSGGALGASLRWAVGECGERFFPGLYSFTLILINLTGCIAIGFLTELLIFWHPSPWLKSFLITGFLGGFTTFSAFAVEFALLSEHYGILYAGGYALVSVAASLLGFYAGSGFGRLILMP